MNFGAAFHPGFLKNKLQKWWCFSTLMSIEMSGGRLLSVRALFLTEDNGLWCSHCSCAGQSVILYSFPSSAVINIR